MPRPNVQPVTVNDILLAAAIDSLDAVLGVLSEIRDRLPAGTAVGQAGPETTVEDPLAATKSDDEEQPAVREPVLVTEPAPVKAPTKAPKKAAPKPGKES